MEKQGILHFLFYNNTVPIVFTIFFLGIGAAAASTEAVQNAVVQGTESVRSVDNGYLLGVNLDNFEVYLTIESIVEDEFSYLVRYSYNTISIVDYVWQPTEVEKTLSVSKEALGEKDLGLYVAEQLGQVVDAEMTYLRDAQEAEQRMGATKKIVVTEYSGLVGRMLDPDTEVFEGYVPVHPEENEAEFEPTVTAAGIGSTSYSEADREEMLEEQRRIALEQYEAGLAAQEKMRKERPSVEEQVHEILEDQEEPLEEDETPTSTSTPEESTSEEEPTGTSTPTEPTPDPETEPEPEPTPDPEPTPEPEPEPEPEEEPEPESPTE